MLCEILSDRSPLIALPENETLFNDSPEIAFEKIQNITFPENLDNDIDNDYTYRMQATEVEDAGYILFIVRFIDKIKFLVGEYCSETFRYNYINEIVVEQKVIDEIVVKIAKTYKHILSK